MGWVAAPEKRILLLLLHNNPVNQGHYSVVDNTISEAQSRELKKAELWGRLDIFGQSTR